jgi:hypothetical protein
VNWSDVLLWGFAATAILTILMSGSESLRFTRISIPFMLGTIFTPDRDLAKLIGFLVHMVNGWVFALIYAALFQSWGFGSWWLGAITGSIHGLFVLVAVMPILPGLHPRMASEQRGPTPTKMLEPPGPLALNYGRRTPLAIFVAHVIYGAILGTLYRLA